MADEKRSFEPPVDGLSANPEEDWGRPHDEGAVFSANHATRGEKSQAERMIQGAKTRHATKDAISRRG